MKVYDVTVMMREGMPVFGGDPPFSRKVVSTGIPELSVLTMGSHTGTHVDAPAHMIEGGSRVESLSPAALVGPCAVREVAAEDVISLKDLQQMPWEGVERVFFKTRNSALWSEPGFHKDFVALTGEAAAFLADMGLKMVGVDYLSVEKFGTSGHPAHGALLSAGVVVVEGLDLSAVPAGEGYLACCAPLKVAGGDGAPARVFLVRTER